MAGSSATVVQSQVDASVFTAKKMQKTVISFVGDSATGAIPAVSVPLAGRILKVVYIKKTTSPTNSTVLTIIDPNTLLDVLKAAATITAGGTSQEFYPVVASGIAIQPVIEANSYSLAITGNSVDSANGSFEIYTGEV